MDCKATSVAVASATAEKSTASICKLASSSSSTSKPSEVLRATLSALKTDVQQPSEMDSIAETGAVASFEGLARETQSAAAQSTTSISAKEAVEIGFFVAINGQVVKSTPGIPQTKSFGFSLKHARSSSYSSVPPTSTWSASYPSATGTRAFGCKGSDTSESDEDYDLPLLKRFCKRKEAKPVVSSPAAMEEDSVEECLHGTSVVDPLVSDRLVTEPFWLQTLLPICRRPIPCPLPEAVSSPKWAEHESPQDTSTPASCLSSGPILLESSPDLFTLLTAAAPVIADSTESASRSVSVPPDVELFSDPAGQDRIRELMLELPTLDLIIFNFISLNINSLNDHLKRTAFLDWFKCMKADIVCLQETHAPSHDTIKKWFANSGYCVASSCHTNKSCGTAILIKDSFSVNKIIKDDAGRFVQVLVNFSEDQLSFASLYAPNKNPERNTFLLSLADLIDLSRPVFIAGDFNSVLDPQLDRKRRPSFVDRPSSRFQESGVALQSLLQQTQTYPLWCDLHPGRIAYSWTTGSGTFASRIDMICAPVAMADLVQECEYYPSFLTDHQYLLVKCCLREHLVMGLGVWKFNTSLLTDPS